jgi:hypothetical protein
LATWGQHVTNGDDLRWADAEMELGDIFCLTFIKGVDETEALRRMGALPDTIATRTLTDVEELHNFDDGYPDVALVVPLDGWAVLFEPNGFSGSNLLAALSAGTEAVSVLRHDYASPAFGYALAGTLITQFDPMFPADRYGAGPDRLVPQMLDVGFDPADDDDDREFDDEPTSRSLRLTKHITGVLPTLEALTGPLTSAHVEDWFSMAVKEPAGRPGHDGPVDAFAEVERLTNLLGLTDTPGLADALASAPVSITPESPLGRHVRSWLTESRRAGWSLNDHSARHRMTDAERTRAHQLGWLARALGAALQSQST